MLFQTFLEHLCYICRSHHPLDVFEKWIFFHVLYPTFHALIKERLASFLHFSHFLFCLIDPSICINNAFVQLDSLLQLCFHQLGELDHDITVNFVDISEIVFSLFSFLQFLGLSYCWQVFGQLNYSFTHG